MKSVAGCGRLQLEVAHWATSVALLQLVDNWPHKKWCKSINQYEDEIIKLNETYQLKFDVNSAVYMLSFSG